METPTIERSVQRPVERSGEGRRSPFAPADIARAVAPLATAAAATAAGIVTLRRSKPVVARRAARFVNLLLASLLMGNGVGAVRFVHPALRTLAPREYLAAERAITRHYLPMLVLMPASILSGLLVLALMPRRRGISFALTIAGTLSMVGILVTTLVEMPLNRQTLTVSPDAPEIWLQHRSRWDRFNLLRTLLAGVGWSCLCIAALTESRR